MSVAFLAAIEKGLDFVSRSEKLLTLGIKPNRPETGYGKKPMLYMEQYFVLQVPAEFGFRSLQVIVPSLSLHTLHW